MSDPHPVFPLLPREVADRAIAQLKELDKRDSVARSCGPALPGAYLMPGYGQCSHCFTAYALRKDGTVIVHRNMYHARAKHPRWCFFCQREHPGRVHCLGSRQMPVPGTT